MLLIFSHYGLTEEKKVMAFFIILLSSIIHALTSLFEPWLSEISVKEDTLNYATEFGGHITVQLDLLDPDNSYLSENGLLLTDQNEQSVFISSKLFLPSDISKIIDLFEEG